MKKIAKFEKVSFDQFKKDVITIDFRRKTKKEEIGLIHLIYMTTLKKYMIQ